MTRRCWIPRSPRCPPPPVRHRAPRRPRSRSGWPRASCPAQAQAEKDKVSGLIDQASSSINQYSNQISDAERKALAYEAEIKKKEEDLDYLRHSMGVRKNTQLPTLVTPDMAASAAL